MRYLSAFIFAIGIPLSSGLEAGQDTSPLLIDLRGTPGVPSDRAGVEIRLDTPRKVEGAVFVARGDPRDGKKRESRLVLPSLPLGENRVSVRWEQLAASGKEESKSLAPAEFKEFDIVASNGRPLDATLITWHYMSPLLMDLRATEGVPADSAGVEICLNSPSKVEDPVFIARGYQFRLMRESRLILPPLAKGENRVRVRWEQLPSNKELIEPVSPIHFNELDVVAADGSPLDAKLVSWNYIRGNVTPMQPAWECIKSRSFAADAEGWRPGIPSDGFGRFGWVRPSGLLVGSLRPDGFEVRAITDTGAELHGIWSVRTGSAAVPVWTRTQADWVSVAHSTFYDYTAEMKNELAMKAPELLKSRRVPLRLIGSSLAPGFLVDSTEKTFRLNNEESGKKGAGVLPRLYIPTRDGMRWIKGGEVFPGKDMSEGWLVAVWPGYEAMPILLVPQKRPETVRADDTGVEIVFPGSLGRVGMSYPAGYRAWRGDDGQLAQNSRRLAAIMRAYPDGCMQQFRVSPDGAWVEIRETFRHILWENDWQEPAQRIAPASPLLNFAAANGYPVKMPAQIADMDWPTKCGPYAAASGAEITYTLPVPEAGTRLYLRPAGWHPLAADIAKELLSVAKMREDIWLRTDCLRGWWMWAPSSLALPLFEDAQRDEFLKRWRWTLDHNLRPHIWFVRAEPFSGARYPVSFGWLERHTWTLGDINSGAGAVLYGLWAYARSSGDWDLVKERWPVMRGAFEYYLVQHDWCQMQTGAREHSGSSAIDMDGIGYEGAVAFTAMADALGRADEAALGRLLVARLAVPTAVRWLGQKWTHPQEKRNDWDRIGVGLSEVRGFDFLDSRKGGPDHVASELALSLSWAGQYPELYHLHRWTLGDDFWRWFEDYYVEHKIEDWRKNHPGNRNSHPANITAHLYMRALLGEPADSLRGELERQAKWGLAPKSETAQENAAFYALLLGRDFPVSLVAWGRAGVKKARYDTADGKQRAVLEFSSKTPFTLELALARAPRQTTVNGRALSADAVVIKNNRARLEIPEGESRIILQFQ
ncbi:hypothetical protein OH491_22330 [Termitidicoccus mucosus]|uniref:Uncharacterized protein n=1 Tax=Termitidicoccus mucosus TaxID=1184151 RepID=A0A178IQ69_9BACT|nr:hypothetical protein AW736_04145 [Opitutaceae bacterium TSB47]